MVAGAWAPFSVAPDVSNLRHERDDMSRNPQRPQAEAIYPQQQGHDSHAAAMHEV